MGKAWEPPPPVSPAVVEGVAETMREVEKRAAEERPLSLLEGAPGAVGAPATPESLRSPSPEHRGPKSGAPAPSPEAVPSAPPPSAPTAPSGSISATDSLFDADTHRAKRHPYAPDEYGRCQTCGVVSDGSERTHSPGLADKFLVPPFSILDTRQDYWQKRRRLWLSLGIRGETTAEQSYTPQRGGAGKTATGTYSGQGNRALLKAEREGEEGLGRKQGLIYQHDAPASDPSFYDKKRAVERVLGREITTEEFKRDHYKREEQVLGESQSIQTGTSVFDPVLCEIAYRWFSKEGARVLDPFAGGVVRGLVAGALGREYVGTELRPEQIADNRQQAEALLASGGGIDWGREPVMPRWIEHDAARLDELDLVPADLVLTCPPYADLEVYSNDPRDLSTMSYERFREALGKVMSQSASHLRQDRFAVWVVGEARGKDGSEYGFVADTIKAAQAAGLALYNSAILVNSVGSAALRAQLILRSRKLTRVHQHVLVFLKGDAKRAAAACGSADIGDPTGKEQQR